MSQQLTIDEIQIFNIDGLLIVARLRYEARKYYEEQTGKPVRRCFQLYRTGFLAARIHCDQVGSRTARELIEMGLRAGRVPFVFASVECEATVSDGKVSHAVYAAV